MGVRRALGARPGPHVGALESSSCRAMGSMTVFALEPGMLVSAAVLDCFVHRGEEPILPNVGLQVSLRNVHYY